MLWVCHPWEAKNVDCGGQGGAEVTVGNHVLVHKELVEHVGLVVEVEVPG
jgi:hypothetical protein